MKGLAVSSSVKCCPESRAGSQRNNAFTCRLIPPMRCGERYVFRRQETRLQDGYAARLRTNRVGACCIRPFSGPARSPQSANGAGDAAIAVDARCRNQTVRAPRANHHRRAAKRGSAATCTSRCRGAEGRCCDRIAAGSGRKDRSPDQGSITDRYSGARVKRASPESITTTGSMDSGPVASGRQLPTQGASRNDTFW